ncbi:MAG: sulfotransferase, partial [Gammaproteobacteria bacterium]|nr:sulfotransferase [Gammaproteobacteria bacterium]
RPCRCRAESVPRPLFVLGIARSGTNLLARMLDRHPQVCVALDPLMPVFRSLRNAVIRECAPAPARARFKPESAFQDFYFDPDGPALLDTLLGGSMELKVSPEDLRELRKAVHQRAALESLALAERLTALEGSTYTEIFRSAFAIIAQEKPAAVWVGIKEVWVIDFVPMLARAFPEARFYAIERDPRAVIASIVAMAEQDPSQAAHLPSYMRHWRKNVALARAYARRPELGSRFRALYYEDLAADPQSGAIRLCEELSIEYHPGMLDLSADGWTGNSSYGEGRGVYSRSVERWRESLPEDVRLTTDYLCGPEMALTRYRSGRTAGLEPVIQEYLRRSERLPGSWRSSSGDPDSDFAGETLRHVLLETRTASDTEVVRRSYLFTETLAAIVGGVV